MAVRSMDSAAWQTFKMTSQNPAIEAPDIHLRKPNSNRNNPLTIPPHIHLGFVLV